MFLSKTLIIIYCRVFHQILDDMDNDWSECINIDQHLHMMTIKANISHFISNTIINFTMIVGIFYFLGEYAIRFVFVTKDYNNTLRRLPITIEFPFESQQSPTYEFLVVTIVLHGLLHVFTVSILNGLIFTVVIHILHLYFNFY